MSESSDPSDQPQPAKRCRVCATDDPFNPSATPYTAASAAYLSLYSSAAGTSLRDQGTVGPPQLSGPQVPIVFDNLVPYTDPQQKLVTNIEPRVRITRPSANPSGEPTIFKTLPHLDQNTNPDHRSLFIDILEYHTEIDQYTPENPPPRDLQIPALYSKVLSGNGIVHLNDAVEESDIRQRIRLPRLA